MQVLSHIQKVQKQKAASGVSSNNRTRYLEELQADSRGRIESPAATAIESIQHATKSANHIACCRSSFKEVG